MARLDLPYRVLSAFFLLFAHAACSGGDSAEADPGDAVILPDTETGDTSIDDTAGVEDVGLDAADDADEEVIDIPLSERLPYGDVCTRDPECIGNLCLQIEAGVDEGFCSGFCFADEDCPDDEWSCIFLSNSGGDASFVCVPDNLCIDRDEDLHGIGPGCAGPDCQDDNSAIYLGADELCDGIDNDCDGNIDDNPIDANEDCATGFPGQCAAGLSRCNSGFIECEPLRVASNEICDTIDNDCDGETDEAAAGGPYAEVCYGGPEGTLDVGECAAGSRGCIDGSVTACVGQVLPLPEICDGLDNDCDGSADEGDPGTGILCETEALGACRRGMTVCGESASECESIAEPVDELCDGLDNDCDGEVDEAEGGDPLTRSCYGGPDDTLGVGACIDGVQTCEGGEWSRCQGEVVPTIELCSSADEDCDGEVNEGNPASGFLCETGDFGLCAFGRTDCGEGGSSGPDCVPDFEPAPEMCDGFDNDCDNEVDEGDDGEALSRVCYDGPDDTAGVGVCETGIETCPFGDWSSCVGQTLPSVEICDGLDNDCDGFEDEGNPGGGLACTTGLDGICARGRSTCFEGAVVCAAEEEPGDEVCDGLDNDCDGDVDEGELWAGASSLCFVGNGLCRAGGVLQCDPDDPEGALICSAEPGTEGEEICDGADNDCDGETDEDAVWGDLGDVCTVGDGLCQRAGIRTCNVDDPSGATVCDADPSDPAEEVCDGLDNDCDGLTDEEPRWSDASSGCFVGDGICRRAGVLVCDPDAPSGDLVCSSEPGDPVDEVCDGLDNDCDGLTDEGPDWADLGDVCFDGLGMCRRAGVVTCNPDDPEAPSVCGADRGAPTDEICDGADNDCDGSADEDAIWATVGEACAEGAGACESAGVVICDPDDRSGPPICGAAIGDPTDEVCDGIDNDCDGFVDENPIWSSVGDVCFAGEGACQRAGVLICNADDRTGAPVCSVDPGPDSPEICDGVDNDCDGATDEDPIWSAAGSVCTEGVGICQRSGVLTCDPDDRSGALVCSAEPGTEETEVCDGLDNDCDGETDEGDLWENVGSVCVVGDGVCQRAGVFACDADTPSGPSTCTATPGDSSDEICDGLDNDCDGTTDEDFPTLGDSCIEGAGVCRAAGVVVCAGDLAVSCDADPPEPASPTELACDYLDDDCDGTVDEDFVTGGLYTGVENCGGCGVDCNGLWDPSPETFHVVPTCNTFLFVASCAYDCEDGWFDLDLDPSNGCEFSPDLGSIYVTTAGAGGEDDVSCGAYDDPCASISYAIALADPVTRPRVLVADGLWTENIVMRSGVSVLGGHNSVNWVRSPDINVSAISGIDSDLDNAAIVAAGITGETELSGFTITAAPGRTGGGNSIGVHVIDSDNGLTITGNRIFAASGGEGGVGAAGTGGSNGFAGTVGASSVIDDSGCTGDLTGGAPGANSCGASTIDGGIGGDSECPVFGTGNDDGDDGAGLFGGTGGVGGGHLYGRASLSGVTCSVSAGIAADASDGLAGSAGTDGTGGDGAPGGYWIESAQVRRLGGSLGTAGTHGSGGGGGGAAAGLQVDSSIQVYYGASGGGGGSGGCAGDGGAGGGSGGGSFPVLVVFSTSPSDSGAMPTIADNELTRGQGGTGGSGGNGGPGGEPGAGAAGGAGVDDGTFGYCMFDAGAGAEGGRGGHGGGGGGGGGGASYDIFVWNADGADPGYSANTFIRGGTDTSGSGGGGGLAVNPDAIGDAGGDGESGTVGFFEP